MPENVISDTLSADDYMIINSTFPHLVVIPPPGATREFGYSNFNFKDRKLPDEYFRAVFFTTVLAPLSDTVGFFPRPEDSLKIEDPAVQNLYYRLFSGKLSELNIEADSVTNTGFWKLIPVRKGQKVEQKIGERVLSYSRIVYNTDKTKAVFYLQNSCSGLCGFGMFVVVEKVNGIWTITKQYNDWVS